MNKKFKKVLVVLLSALMVLTYMPSMALTAFAAGADYKVTDDIKIPDQVWTGELPDLSEVLSEITVTKNQPGSTNITILRYGEDFTVEASTADVGNATAYFTCINKFSDCTIQPMTFKIIEPPSTDVYTVTLNTSKFVYDGDKLDASEVLALKAAKVLKNGNQKVELTEENIEVTEPAGATGDAGEKYKVKIFKGTLFSETFDVTILKKDISTATTISQHGEAWATGSNGTYNGKEKAFTFSRLTVDGLNLYPADYDITGYTNNVNVNTADTPITATIVVKDTAKNFTGSADVPARYNRLSISQARVSGNANNFVEIATPKTFVYDGKEHTVTASDLGLKVFFSNERNADEVPAADYVVVFSPATIQNARTYGVRVDESDSGNVNFSLTNYVANAVTVTPASMADVTVTQTTDVQVNTEITNANFDDYFEVKLGDLKLEAGTDFTVAYTVDKHNRLNQESTLELTGRGNFDTATKKEVKYTAVATKFAKAYTSDATGDYFVYDGTAKTPDNIKLGQLNVKGTDTGAQTLDDAQYRVLEGSYQNNVNAGTATATIVGNGTFEGEQATVEFKIAPKPLPSSVKVSGIADGTYYVGAEISGATVKIGTTVLTADDCTVTVAHITDDFKMDKVTVKGIGNYTGTQTVGLDAPLPVAKQADLSKATVEGPIPAGLAAYDAATLKNFITVVVDGTEILPVAYNIVEIEKTAPATGNLGDLDSTISFRLTSANAQVINSKTVSMTVTKRNLSDFDKLATLTGATGLKYDGTAKTPGVQILTTGTYAKGDRLVANTDYKVAYADNKDAGTATVTITGAGNYEGTLTKTFKIGKATITSANFDNYFTVPAPAASKRQYKVGAPDDLSSILSVDKKEGVKYEISAADYTITQNEKPVKVGSGAFKEEVEKTDRASNVRIYYTLRFNKDSKNYEATPATEEGIAVSYPMVARTVNDAVITLENDQLVYNGTTTFPETTDNDDIKALGIKVVVDGTELERGTSNTYGNNKDYTVILRGSRNLPSKYTEGEVPPYVEVSFHGNYTGYDSTTKFSIVAKPIDISDVKVIPPKAANSVYTGHPILATTSEIGDDPLPADSYKLVYTNEAGEVVEPVNVGKYTATVWSTIDYGSVKGESVDYEITAEALTKAEFKDQVDALVAGRGVEEGSAINVLPVYYSGENTEAPKLFTLVGGALKESSDFEVVSYDKTWDGKAASKGKATVALKKNANYKFDGTGEVEFSWTPGILDRDPSKYYEIADQEYTGEELEPPLKVKDGQDVELEWATVKYYSDNIEIADKTAKAFVEVKVPAGQKYTEQTFSGFITFTIKAHELTPEEAREDAEEAGHIAALILSDPTYPDAAKAIVQEAIDALNEVLDNPLATPEDIEDAVDDLYYAMDEAKDLAEALIAADEALAEAAKVDDTYPADAKELVDEAKAALYEAIEGGDPEEIEDATSDLELAVAVADVAKAAQDAEKKAKEEALEEAGEAIVEALAMALTGDYTDESMAAINDAAANLAEVAGKEDATAAEIKAATEKLQKAMDKAVAKQVTSIAVSDVKAVYSGKAPEVPTPIVLGSTGKVSYKFYADAEGKTELAAAPVDAGKYFYKATVEADANFKSAESQIAKFDIDKAASKISKIKPTSKNTKAGKKFTLKATVKAGDGKVTFKKTSGNKKIKVAKSGKVTVKNGLAKGTYKIKVKAKIAKTANYKAASKKATIKITVK